VVIPAKEISGYLTKGGHPDGADPGCVPDMPMVLAVNLVNSALVAFELASYLEQTRWWIFFGLVVTLTGVRAAGWRCYYHNQKTEGAPGKWALFATAGSGLSGLLWGLGSTLLLPDNIVEQTFFAFVIGGMCAARFVGDSPLEGDGFELSVPGAKEPVSVAEGELRGIERGRPKKLLLLWGTDGSNPSPSSGESGANSRRGLGTWQELQSHVSRARGPAWIPNSASQ